MYFIMLLQRRCRAGNQISSNGIITLYVLTKRQSIEKRWDSFLVPTLYQYIVVIMLMIVTKPHQCKRKNKSFFGLIRYMFTMLKQLCFGFYLTCWHVGCSVPGECFNYYSEFSLDPSYNPNVTPDINTTITENTTIYKILEVSCIVVYYPN